MRFPSMLRRLRNTRGGIGSTAKSASTPYTPEPSTLEVMVFGNPQTVSVGAPVKFIGSVSNAPASATLTYSWSFDDGAASKTVNGLKASCVYTTRGEKTVTLTVSYTNTDGEIVEASGSVTITVIVPPPTIVEPSFEVMVFGKPQTVSVGAPVKFIGSVSNAPASATLTYSWSFDDGAASKTVNGLKASCVYTTRGEKTVTLTVSYTDADDEEVAASDDVIITVIEPLMPWCTSELPAQAPAVIQLAPIPSSPPDYAVSTAYVPPPDTSPIPLQAERQLSELEKAAIDLVFKDSPSFSPTMLANTVRIKVEDLEITPDGDWKRGDQIGDLIIIYRRNFLWGDAIDADSTVGNTDIFKPGNLDYLNTFIHEAAHWWQTHQRRYHRLSLPSSERNSTTDPKRYDFDYDQLRNLTFDDKEAHASAVATWFIIAWQLEHRPADQLINVTGRGQGRFRVGTVARYSEIAKIDFLTPAKRATSPPVGSWITREDAKQLACHFKPLIEEIQTAQPLPASD